MPKAMNLYVLFFPLSYITSLTCLSSLFISVSCGTSTFTPHLPTAGNDAKHCSTLTCSCFPGLPLVEVEELSH